MGTTCLSNRNSSCKYSKKGHVARRVTKAHMSVQENVIGLNNTTNAPKQSIQWQPVKYKPLNLYPSVSLDDKNNPTRHPTPSEVKQAI